MHLFLGFSDPRSIASAIRILTLTKNWLHGKRFRTKNIFTADSNHFLYRNVEDRKNKNISVADEVRLRRERSDGISRNVLLEKNRRSYAISLHYHLSSLSDFVSSLFGCEEWLRAQLKKMVAREAIAEVFAAW